MHLQGVQLHRGAGKTGAKADAQPLWDVSAQEWMKFKTILKHWELFEKHV